MLSTGRPRADLGREASSSEARIMSLGSAPAVDGWWMYGTVVREDSSLMYEGGYTCVWMSTTGWDAVEEAMVGVLSSTLIKLKGCYTRLAIIRVFPSGSYLGEGVSSAKENAQVVD